MGGKQSQEASPVSQLTPAPVPVVSTAREEDESPSVLVPTFFNPFSSSTANHEPIFPESRLAEDEVEPPAIPIRPFFPSTRSEDSTPDPPRHRSSSANHHRDRPQHHHSQEGSSSGQERTRQHRRHHHHHHQRGERDHERRSHHDRRARRYVYGELDSTGPLELDFSLMALNQRLRDLQQRRESEENGTSSGSGGASSSGRRHGGRSGSHSHSRNQVSASMPAGSLFFMRPSHRRSTCPFCRKEFSSSDMDTHVLTCMTKPKVEYNEDRLIQDAGECSICLDDMYKGDAIARLPCLCVYHIKCLKLWYEKNQTCPEHPEFIA